MHKNPRCSDFLQAMQTVAAVESEKLSKFCYQTFRLTKFQNALAFVQWK
jgi:hypothetical protein